MKVLVTGAAGFIGMHAVLDLLARGDQVFGIDNLNDYYDPQLKRDRLTEIAAHPAASHFQYETLDLADNADMAALFERERFDRVVHLGAQAGVRYSLTNPHVYAQSNLVGFLNVLEGCRNARVEHLVYASSSSVYGANTKMPFAEADSVDHPVSLYAATKKANELMAHTYSHLYALPTTGLRFFTVYGPWGRPDMAPMLFARAILAGEPIRVFNHGNMRRDFTYVGDIVRALLAALDRIPSPNPELAGSDEQRTPANSWAPFRVFNIGRSEPVELGAFIDAMERAFGKRAMRDYQPLQAGDVVATYADTSALEAWTGVKPEVRLEDGIQRFADWYKRYFHVA